MHAANRDPANRPLTKRLLLTCLGGAFLGALIGAAAPPSPGEPKSPSTEAAARSKPSAHAPRPKASAAPAPKSPRRRYRVAAMGDSLTDPRSQGGKYLETLRARCPESRFDSYGRGGNMVNQMLKRFQRDILAAKRDKRGATKPAYSHVIILGGINDICSDRSAHRSNDKIKRDLVTMYGLARAQEMTVIALTLPPWGGFKRYYNERRAASTFELNRWITAQEKAQTVDHVVDIFPHLSCGKAELLCARYGLKDRVHWSAEGHRVVGELLHKTVFGDCR